MRFLLFLFLFLLPLVSFALPIEIQFAIEDIVFDFEDILTLAWPLIANIVIAFLMIKVFKHFVSLS